jgi:hypothetical protein
LGGRLALRFRVRGQGVDSRLRNPSPPAENRTRTMIRPRRFDKTWCFSTTMAAAIVLTGCGSATGRTLEVSQGASQRAVAQRFADALVKRRSRRDAQQLATPEIAADLVDMLATVRKESLGLASNARTGCPKAQVEPFELPSNAYCYRFALLSAWTPSPSAAGYEEQDFGTLFVAVSTSKAPKVTGIAFTGGGRGRRAKR